MSKKKEFAGSGPPKRGDLGVARAGVNQSAFDHIVIATRTPAMFGC